MTYRLLIRRQAKGDLRQATRWYERKMAGLGREFVAEIDAVLDRILENPLQYQIVYRHARRAITRKFPYGVFYRVDVQDIIRFRNSASAPKSVFLARAGLATACL